MRGLVYGRLRDMMRPLPAILWSALFFGLFHGNLVQGVYATACGIYLGWIMERFRTIKATAVAHIAANAFITILFFRYRIRRCNDIFPENEGDEEDKEHEDSPVDNRNGSELPIR